MRCCRVRPIVNNLNAVVIRTALIFRDDLKNHPDFHRLLAVIGIR